MTIHGYKTKAGIVLLFIAAILAGMAKHYIEAVAYAGLAIGFWGLYDRGNRNNKSNVKDIDEAFKSELDRRKIRKPRLI